MTQKVFFPRVNDKQLPPFEHLLEKGEGNSSFVPFSLQMIPQIAADPEINLSLSQEVGQYP
jgi:hypothetical protein